jgi:molybdate transport system substrate-binding protein
MRCDFSRWISLILGGIWVVFAISCKNQKKDDFTSVDKNNKEKLIIYCENSLVPLLMDLKPTFEQTAQCNIQIINDCSQNLIGLVNFSQQGDLFFPDTHTAFGQLRRSSQVDICDSVFIGYNRLVLLVPKGNPNHLTGNLNILSHSSYSLILPNPETGSLGYEIKKVLVSKKIYDNFLKNVIRMTVDSKGLDRRLLNSEADYSFCWQSDAYGNGLHVTTDTLNIEPSLMYDVYGGVLTCSRNDSLAKCFLDFVSSDIGITSARNHGISKRKIQVF